PSLRGTYPPWIHLWKYPGPSSLLFPWRSDLVTRLRQYDMAVVSGMGPVFAQFTRRPWCFFATGGDLTIDPFPLRWLDPPPTARAKAAALVRGFWQRRGIQRATEVWTQPFAPFELAADRLSVRQERISSKYFPVMIDVDKFTPDPGARASDDENIR